MSFQLTVLKVLAGHPEGRATLIDLRKYVAVLISSGAEWTLRMKRLAALAPELDIFTQSFVLRDAAGWQITAAGREFLQAVEETRGSVETNITVTAPVIDMQANPSMVMLRIVDHDTKSYSRRRRAPRRSNDSARKAG